MRATQQNERVHLDDATPRNALLRSLGALSSAPRRAGEDLAEIPAGALLELLAEVEDGWWRPDDGLRLLGLLAKDPRPTVRREVVKVTADRAEELPPEAAEALLLALADDPSRLVRVEVGRRLGDWLATLEPHVQEGVIDRWSEANADGPRLALARALAEPLSVAGDEHAIETLAGDALPEVRAAAAAAAGVRLAEDWSPFGEVLEDLALDACPEVHRAARAALGFAYRPLKAPFGDDAAAAELWS